jgi:hypothetical protein
MGAPPCILHV